MGMIIALATATLFCGQASAKECTMFYYDLILPSQPAEFVETASGGTLTVFDTGLGEEIVFNLDRQVLTNGDTGVKFSALVGSETVKREKIVNELRVLLHEGSKKIGNQSFTISSKTLFESLAREEETVMFGGLICR